MKILLTVGFDGDREAFAKAMQGELSNMVSLTHDGSRTRPTKEYLVP
jgi:hypothetical protein